MNAAADGLGLMLKYRVADLNLAMRTESRRVLKQAEIYRFDFNDSPDLVIDLNQDYLIELHQKNLHLTLDDVEYIETGTHFYKKIIDFNGLLIHASAIIFDDFAYLFSGPSGVGKSTHTQGWIREFGKERVQIMNDDKPAVRSLNGVCYAYGTPWTGKECESLNIKKPIGGILLLEQARENRIDRVQDAIGLFPILDQSVRANSPAQMAKQLQTLNLIFNEVPIFKMKCALGSEGIRLSYQTLTKAAYERFKK